MRLINLDSDYIQESIYRRGFKTRQDIEEWLNNAPFVDAVPVVRCKDCDAWKRNVGIVDSPNGHCFEHDIDTNRQDFCSYGEKKDVD